MVGKAFGKGNHKRAHGLVFCQVAGEASSADVGHSIWLEDRLQALETAMSGLERSSANRQEVLSGRLDQFSAQTRDTERSSGARLDALDGRMEKIEGMLALLLARLGADQL